MVSGTVKELFLQQSTLVTGSYPMISSYHPRLYLKPVNHEGDVFHLEFLHTSTKKYSQGVFWILDDADLPLQQLLGIQQMLTTFRQHLDENPLVIMVLPNVTDAQCLSEAGFSNIQQIGNNDKYKVLFSGEVKQKETPHDISFEEEDSFVVDDDSDFQDGEPITYEELEEREKKEEEQKKNNEEDKRKQEELQREKQVEIIKKEEEERSKQELKRKQEEQARKLLEEEKKRSEDQERLRKEEQEKHRLEQERLKREEERVRKEEISKLSEKKLEHCSYFQYDGCNHQTCRNKHEKVCQDFIQYKCLTNNCPKEHRQICLDFARDHACNNNSCQDIHILTCKFYMQPRGCGRSDCAYLHPRKPNRDDATLFVGNSMTLKIGNAHYCLQTTPNLATCALMIKEWNTGVAKARKIHKMVDNANDTKSIPVIVKDKLIREYWDEHKKQWRFIASYYY